MTAVEEPQTPMDMTKPTPRAITGNRALMLAISLFVLLAFIRTVTDADSLTSASCPDDSMLPHAGRPRALAALAPYSAVR